VEIQNLGRRKRPECAACGGKSFYVDSSKETATVTEFYAKYRCVACGTENKELTEDFFENVGGGPLWG
jgi:DNA-directed RNA polymerase subunit RPC12/RpoP